MRNFRDPLRDPWVRQCRERERQERSRALIRQAIDECRRGDFSNLDLLESEFDPRRGQRRPDDRRYRTSHEEINAFRQAAEAALGVGLPADDKVDHPERG